MKNLKQFPMKGLLILSLLILGLSIALNLHLNKVNNSIPTLKEYTIQDIYYYYTIVDGDTLLIGTLPYYEDNYGDDIIWEELPRHNYIVDNIEYHPIPVKLKQTSNY